VDPPTEAEREATRHLEAFLKEAGSYESEEMSAARVKVIAKLQRMAEAWCEDLHGKAGSCPGAVPRSDALSRLATHAASNDRDGSTAHPPAASLPSLPSEPRQASHPKPLLLPFGSYRLDCHDPISDLDLLLVLPQGLASRADFFQDFAGRVLRHHSGVSGLCPVPEAFTPVLKFRMDGLAVDLLFVALHRAAGGAKGGGELSGADLLDPSFLRGLDEWEVRSLNGVRVAEAILRLVPEPATFSLTLRALKLWARRRKLYSSVLGFLGGVNLAILAAFVCQKYPLATPAALLLAFFRVYARWPWPSPAHPVLLCPLPPPPHPAAGTRPLPPSLMTIMTPTFPAMNSAHNVGLPQLRRLQEELRRAESLTRPWLLDPRLLRRLQGGWRALCAPAPFFARFQNFLQVEVWVEGGKEGGGGGQVEEGALERWFGWVESRLRHLVSALEHPPFLQSHPYAEALPSSPPPSPPPSRARARERLSFFVALVFAPSVARFDVSPAVEGFLLQVRWPSLPPSLPPSPPCPGPLPGPPSPSGHESSHGRFFVIIQALIFFIYVLGSFHNDRCDYILLLF
jgi:poly(A) polymerase